MTEPRLLDVNDATKLLEEAVAEKGTNYVYPGKIGDFCAYVRGGKPSCIVAHVFYRAGVPIEVLRSWDGKGSISALQSSGRLYDAGLHLTESAFRALRAAQSTQDLRRSWGQALEAAKLTRSTPTAE